MRAKCPAADAGRARELAPSSRRQGRYEGSMRQRRGRLLRALAEDGRVDTRLDPEAAASLLAEGLARGGGHDLLPAR